MQLQPVEKPWQWFGVPAPARTQAWVPQVASGIAARGPVSRGLEPFRSISAGVLAPAAIEKSKPIKPASPRGLFEDTLRCTRWPHSATM